MPDVSELPLRDIHLPGPVPWWPPAPGWWILAALVVAAIAGALVYRRLTRHRRAALRAVRALVAELERGAEPVACVQRLSMVMRRYAITTAETREEAAGLTGERWLEYLDARWPEAAFKTLVGGLLVIAPYARPGTVERQEALDLAALCARWIAVQPVSKRRRRLGASLLRPLAARSAA